MSDENAFNKSTRTPRHSAGGSVDALVLSNHAQAESANSKFLETWKLGKVVPVAGRLSIDATAVAAVTSIDSPFVCCKACPVVESRQCCAN